jgi:hypothetical protein
VPQVHAQSQDPIEAPENGKENTEVKQEIFIIKQVEFLYFFAILTSLAKKGAVLKDLKELGPHL